MQNTAKKLTLNSFVSSGRYWTFLGGIFALVLRTIVATQPASAESLLSDGVSEVLTAKQVIVQEKVELKPVFGPDVPPATHELLLDVCQKRGYGEDCAKTLLGMVFKESQFDGDAIGDQGKARGYFQIHYKMHKVSLACAEDLRCSADWTISYLEYNGYPKNIKTAIQCHNGCGANNGYAASVIRNGKRLWPAVETKPVAYK